MFKLGTGWFAWVNELCYLYELASSGTVSPGQQAFKMSKHQHRKIQKIRAGDPSMQIWLLLLRTLPPPQPPFTRLPVTIPQVCNKMLTRCIYTCHRTSLPLLVCLSPTITKCHRQGGLNNSNLFLTFLKAVKSKISVLADLCAW